MNTFRVFVDDPCRLMEAEGEGEADPCIVVQPHELISRWRDGESIKDGAETRYPFSDNPYNFTIKFYLSKKKELQLLYTARCKSAQRITRSGKPRRGETNNEIVIVWQRGTLEQAPQ